MTIMNRIKRSVSNRKKQDFFLTSDFSTFGSKSAVAAALRALTSSGFLIRISLGVYAKTEWNKYTNSRVASMPIGMLAPMALERMGYEIKLGKAAREYADALVTQIPQKISMKLEIKGLPENSPCMDKLFITKKMAKS